MEESGERVVDEVDNAIFTADLIINRLTTI
jgi:hypothetical protein